MSGVSSATSSEIMKGIRIWAQLHDIVFTFHRVRCLYTLLLGSLPGDSAQRARIDNMAKFVIGER